MKDEYQVGSIVSRCGDKRKTITIRRKPSQIPIHIDRTIMHLGCIGDMDGPNSRVTYELFFEKGFKEAIEYLTRYGWTQTTE